MHILCFLEKIDAARCRRQTQSLAFMSIISSSWWLLWKHYFDCTKHVIGEESLSFSTLSIVSHLYQRFCNIRKMSCHFHCAPDEFDALCLIAVHSSWCCSWCYCCCCLNLRRFAIVSFRICEAWLRWRQSVDCRSIARTGSWRIEMLQFPAAASVGRLRNSFGVV